MLDKTSTKLDQELNCKIKKIYLDLISLGCSMIQPTCEQNIHSTIQLFIQATDSRLELIQWLVATINPWYDQDAAYKHSYNDDSRLHQLKKLSICLWQLGVMPFSKHTKNLDYFKYIEGVLGRQASLTLLIDLVELAKAKFSSNLPVEMEKTAGDFIGQLITNIKELVNVDYDPYGVTFPLSKDITKEAEGQEVVNSYQEMLLQLLQENEPSIEEGEEQVVEKEIVSVLDQMDQKKSQFQLKYIELGEKISQLEKKLNPTPHSSQSKALHQKRFIDIPRSLCQSYRQYKKLLGQIQAQTYSSEIINFHQDLNDEIAAINQFDSILLQ